MDRSLLEPTLDFPIDAPPPHGTPVEIAPGLLWIRLGLPFRLDHVNVYVLEDVDGWLVFDTGIYDPATTAIWQSLLQGPLAARPITRIVVSHYHPDHAGMAGWLAERTGAPVLMPATEYLTSLVLMLDPGALDSEPYRSFYRGHGLDPVTTDNLLTLGNRYLKMVALLPRTFRRLIGGETLGIAGAQFHVTTAGGHAPEQAMLHAPARNLLLCADQVLARISPNISVDAHDPDGDPLGIYLRSLATLRASVPADTLVLPGHNLPFIGLHTRIDELTAHHHARCDAILSACRERPRNVLELMPAIFRRPIEDPHQMGFAFSEALAHVNFLTRTGRLHRQNGRFIPA
ncbi:MAG: MBL fold metallo-hydrolase [Acetobacteraceae bacterium]|nr:MBL fold metallo-hydrolase [Acetobacteraceae bacterium]